jgi:hypothetical protein
MTCSTRCWSGALELNTAWPIPAAAYPSPDSDGVLHGVDVDAECLYEAVAITVAQFREDDINPLSPGPMTEFTVAVYRSPVEHKVRLGQVAKWAGQSTH